MTITDDNPPGTTGPDWLAAQRREAADAVSAAEAPTTEIEEWRYSPVADVTASDYTSVTDAVREVPDLTAVAPLLTGAAGVVVTRNGRIVSFDVAGVAPAVVSSLTEGDSPGALGTVMAEPPDVFAQMSIAEAAEPIGITIPAGKVLEAPIVIVHVIDADAARVGCRLAISAGEASQVSVVEIVISPDDVSALYLPTLEMDVADAANVSYVNVQMLGRRTVQISSHAARVGAQSQLAAGLVALGGSYGRIRLDYDLIGRGASVDLCGAYVADGDQTLDFRAFQNHVGADTTSDLLFVGTLDDTSRSVYTGTIRIGEDAPGTNAFQTNRNLKLSDDARAESVPNLEIENNDVRCSHASTVGPIDPEQRFYLESRGVPPKMAERLIVGGFFEAVLGRLPVATVRAPLRAILSERLDAELGVTV
ncbi:MAG: SufD family Fe-S cluster assembly protein [Acidimicrobiales bacterium]